MNKTDVLAALTPEIIGRFRTAIELGKWADGRKLTDEQRHTCMQAVMVWEHEHLPEQERAGYIHKPANKKSCGSDDHSHNHEHNAEQPIKFEGH